MVEVLVALVVCSIGLLGLAKMESLALASTDVAGTRSIAAIEAASLAAMMHANRGYWASSSVPASITITAASNPYASAGACTTPGTSACTPILMASYDLQQWAVGLQALLPGYSAVIACAAPVVSVSPASCTITINWIENAVAINAQQTNITGLAAPSYVLYVEP
jgi:type IV pilus assembly protein PilV